MAKIVKEQIVISISRLAKSGYKVKPFDISDEFKESLEGVVAELLGEPNAVIEVERLEDSDADDVSDD